MEIPSSALAGPLEDVGDGGALGFPFDLSVRMSVRSLSLDEEDILKDLVEGRWCWSKRYQAQMSGSVNLCCSSSKCRGEILLDLLT